jgi:hypothetical protein
MSAEIYPSLTMTSGQELDARMQVRDYRGGMLLMNELDATRKKLDEVQKKHEALLYNLDLADEGFA